MHMPSAGGASLFNSLSAEGDLGRLESRGKQSHTRQQSSPEKFMGGVQRQPLSRTEGKREGGVRGLAFSKGV